MRYSKVIKSRHNAQCHRDYYLAFCETPHGCRYWKLGGDQDTVADREEIKELIRVDALCFEEAEDVARDEYELDLWDGSMSHVKTGPQGDFVNDIDWDGVAKEMSFDLSESASIGYCVGNDDLFAAKSSDGKKLLMLGYKTAPVVETIDDLAGFVFP